MKTNKGYTLAELLVAIAIFSIVMLSIVTVMRNVSISYRNESKEVELQESAQILLSQVEDLLVDCQKCKNLGGVIEITDSSSASGVVHSLKVEDGSVWYQYGSSSYEELAKNVDSFTITDLQSNHGDNKCKVTVSMVANVAGSKNYTYTATKDVVFRNDVEKADAHNGSFIDGGGSPTPNPPSPDTVSVKVGRYQIVNLATEYDIDYTKGITISGGSDKYRFVNADGSDAATGTVTNYFTTSATCNQNTESSHSCTLTAKTSSNQNITLSISTPKVKLLKGTGVVYCPQGTTNDGTNKNFYSYLKIDGISIRDLKKYYGTDCEAELIFTTKDDSKGKGKIYSNTEGNKTEWKDSMKFKNGSNYAQVHGNGNAYMNQCFFGLAYDEYSPDTLCVMFSNGLQANDAFNGQNFEVTVKVYYPSSVTGAHTDETYKLYTSGANLNNLDI